MEIYAITTYVIAEEVLKLLKFQDDPQIVLSDAETQIATKILWDSAKASGLKDL